MSQPPILAVSVKGEAMPWLRHAAAAVTMLLSGVVGSIAGLVAFAGPATAEVPPPDHGAAGTVGSVVGSIPVTTTTSSGSGALGWWAVLVIIVGAVLVVAALAELTRWAVRRHHAPHPAM